MNTTNERVQTPIWFWIISVVALLWNLMGVAAYLYDVSLSPEQVIETYGAVQGQAILDQPSFITWAYALAVFGGALGCVLLLLRKRVAIWPFVISFACVIIQQIYSWFFSGIMGDLTAANKAMYISIPIIAALLIWFTRKMTSRGILT